MSVLRGLNGLQRGVVGRRHAEPLRAGTLFARSLAAALSSSSSSSTTEKEEQHGGLFSSWVGKIKGAFHSKTPSPQPEQQPTSAFTLLACADELKNARRLSTFSSLLKISPHVTEGAATESIEKCEKMMRAVAKHNPTGQNVDEKQKAAAAKECGCTLKEINTMLTNFESMKEARAKLLQMKEKGEELPTMAEFQKVLNVGSPKRDFSQCQSADVVRNAPCTCGSGKKYKSSIYELQKDCMHQVPIWKGENSHLGHGQFWSRSSCHILSRWICQIHGQLGSSSCSSSSPLSQQWSTCLFARSMSMKGREDRRKKDLARREFQLLRRRTKLLKATLSLEERLLWRLRKSNRKKAILLQRLKKYELEEDPEAVHDPELITPEQLQSLKKIGYKNRNYVPVGRRGVYGGVVQNMHMHWKFHETVQVDCHIFKREDIRTIARQLAVLSGGIVIDIHQSTTIIMYRGRNYKQPKTEMIPPNTLTKRKALFKSKYLQALEGLETNMKEIEAQLQMLRRKQKENTAQGAENDTSKPPQGVGDKVVDSSFLDNLSEVSSDDDDGIFSWESDSLDEDELSDDDESKHKKAEEDHLDRNKVVKPLSWTSGDSAGRGGKTNRLTAKELILAEQELFKNSPKRLADGAQKSGSISSQDNELNNNSVDLDDNLRTDDVNEDEKGNGIRDGKFQRLKSFQANDKLCRHTPEVNEVARNYDLEGYLEKDISSCKGNKTVKKSEVANRVKGHQQIMNKKIAKFVEDYMTDEDVDEEFGTDFSESETDPTSGVKSTHGSEEECWQEEGSDCQGISVHSTESKCCYNDG